MKTRCGFVSNSSSASFIIVWEDEMGHREETAMDKPNQLNRALAKLFDLDVERWCPKGKRDIKWDEAIPLFNSDTDEFIFEDEEKYELFHKDSILVNELKTILENTKVKKDYVFETRFFTSMLNSYSDFGSAAMKLVSYLMFHNADDERRFKIVYSTVEKD